MKDGFRLVRIRVDDYLADLLDREASLMPPGFEGNAEILQQQVKFFRESAPYRDDDNLETRCRRMRMRRIHTSIKRDKG
jgi:hypothetical protein